MVTSWSMNSSRRERERRPTVWGERERSREILLDLAFNAS